MITHWLPPFTSRDWRGLQRAACGEPIKPEQHSTEPTCEACATYLARSTALDAELEATFAEPSDPALIVKHRDFDPTGTPRRPRRHVHPYTHPRRM